MIFLNGFYKAKLGKKIHQKQRYLVDRHICAVQLLSLFTGFMFIFNGGGGVTGSSQNKSSLMQDHVMGHLLKMTESNFIARVCTYLIMFCFPSVAFPVKPGGRVRCQYVPAVDKVLFLDDYAVGCRKDLNGILLLDTALQPPVTKPEDLIQMELPVTEVEQGSQLTFRTGCTSAKSPKILTASHSQRCQSIEIHFLNNLSECSYLKKSVRNITAGLHAWLFPIIVY